jgi:hypothetical protein
MLCRLRAIVVTTTIATGLVTSWNASADERDAALDAAIPTVMQKASVPGAIVGIWQDGRAPYVRTIGVRNMPTREPMAEFHGESQRRKLEDDRRHLTRSMLGMRRTPKQDRKKIALGHSPGPGNPHRRPIPPPIPYEITRVCPLPAANPRFNPRLLLVATHNHR